MTRSGILATLTLLATLLATGATAEGASHPWYAGAAYGASKLRHGFDAFSDGPSRDAVIDDSDTAWKLFVGRGLRKHLAIELSLADLNNDVDGQATFSAISGGTGTRPSPGPVSVDLDEPRAAALVLTGSRPLTDRLTALLKAGAAAWTTDRTTWNASGRSTESTSGVDATFGAGVQARLGDRAEIRLEADRYTGVAGDHVDVGFLGVLVRWGAR